MNSKLLWLHQKHRVALALLFGTVMLGYVFLSIPVTSAQESEPPITTHSFSGVIGNNNWYTSNVDVSLRSSDIGSGPKSTTYWLNSETATVKEHISGQNQIVNPSFENGWFFSINNWDHNTGAGFWQSSVYSKVGWRSAAIGNLLSGDQYYYWHNRADFVPSEATENYVVSAWVKTADITGLGAWFEIWAKGATEAEDQLIASSDLVTGSADWTLLEKSFVMPAGFDGVYVKLGMQDTGLAGLAFWDGVSLYGGFSALTEYTIVDNGSHTLHYFSEDNLGNVEAEKAAALKIDTVPPRNWNDFTYTDGQNDHSFFTLIDVSDVTSGVDVSTASYRWYTDHQDLFWSHELADVWIPVASLEVVSTGLPASDGETGEIRLSTDEIDFGDSATDLRVQFRIGDMAGSSADSPVLTIEGAWVQSSGGMIFSEGGILMSASAPAGEYNTDGLVMGGDDIVLFTSQASLSDTDYTHEYSTVTLLDEVLLGHDFLKQQAISLPDNKLPQISGIYIFEGDYVIDHNSTPSSFERDELAAVIFIDGELFIKDGYSMEPTSAVLFVVDGNVSVAGGVNQLEGVFLSSGGFDTNYDNKHEKQLTMKGGIVALGGITLGRDLTRKGNPSNEEAPAESFFLPHNYFFNSEFTDLVSSQQTMTYQWTEVAP